MEKIKAEKPTIREMLDALTKRVEEIEQRSEVVTAPEAPIQVPTQPVNHFPVPLDYQEVVKTILNGKFRIEMDYSSDTASFSFGLFVPQEYSNAGKTYWDMYHEDKRSRVILNALGVNGVREWVQKVYESFDMETRAKIASDRALLV